MQRWAHYGIYLITKNVYALFSFLCLLYLLLNILFTVLNVWPTKLIHIGLLLAYYSLHMCTKCWNFNNKNQMSFRVQNLVAIGSVLLVDVTRKEEDNHDCSFNRIWGWNDCVWALVTYVMRTHILCNYLIDALLKIF